MGVKCVCPVSYAHLLLPNFVFIVIVNQITYFDRKHRRFLYVDVSASDVFAPEAVRKENRRGAFLFAVPIVWNSAVLS